MSTGTTEQAKATQADANMAQTAIAHDADITPTPPSESVIEAGPQRDPPISSITTTASDYFGQAANDTQNARDHNHHAELRPRQHDTALAAHTPKPAPSTAGSNAIAPGTIVLPDFASPAPHDIPSAQERDSSLTPVSTMDPSQSHQHATEIDLNEDERLASSTELSSKPPYPNQAYAALHSQHYPTRNHPPTLRTSSSHPSSVLAFTNIHQSGSRTVGNSPAATPSAGLYSPHTERAREDWDSPDTPGTYASPYLHPTHRQAPKETHVADVDVDPISGRKLINHYEIIDELGRGTHGKVKLGRDLTTSDTYVAIKIVERYSKRRRLGKLGNPEDKVKKEVAILKKARHPSIVALLEVIDDPSRKKVYIVLEWVERGAIQWRAKGPKELAMLEARQYERLRHGTESKELDAEDDALRREVHRLLNDRKHGINRRYRKAMKSQDPDRGIDHFGGSNLDSDDDTTSKASTDYARKASIGPDPNEALIDGTATPTADDAARPLDDTSAQPNFAAISQVKDMRQWAIEYLDTDINPELQYVPCMTLSNIRIAFRDTLLGLQYLHHQGIIHRDIKPPNLLQTTEHRVKISDFGVSYLGRPVHEGEQEEISESEAKDLDVEAKELAKTVGTPAFYAPELCITDHMDDPPPITKAIDVWALGITLFCMIYARTPFVDNEYVVMRQIAEEDIHIPRLRLKPVTQRSQSRPSSRSRTYSPQLFETRLENDVVYEEIGDDLHDLLKRLLVKDPRKRILLEEVRHHPWVVADIQNKVEWLEETDPSQHTEGKKIEVSKEDVNAAVVPIQWVERVRSGIKKFGGRLLGSTARGRSASSATPPASAPNSHPASAHSSSSTISQDAKRHSLRGEDIATALRASRETEHPLATSLAASPELEKADQDFFESLPAQVSNNGFGAPLSQAMSYDSATRPSLPERTRTGYSTAGSIRTIKQSDFDGMSADTPPSPYLDLTPRALDSPITSPGLLIDPSRSIFKVMRERSAARTPGAESTNASRAHISTPTTDSHGEPSLALSETQAAGSVDGSDALLAASTTASTQTSPVSARPHSMMLPPGYRPGFTASSRTSSAGSFVGDAGTGSYANQRSSTNESAPEDWQRADAEHTRRFIQEAQELPRTTTSFDDRTCPPSPDDQRGRKGSDQRRISTFDISQETSPTYGSQLPGSLVSSSSDFGSAVSVSVSNPSIPSVISEASSMDDPDGAPLEDASKHYVSSHDTIRSLPRTVDEPVDEGYSAEADTALDSDEGADDDDSDTDSDGGLVMTRRKSATRPIMLSSSPKIGSLGTSFGSTLSTTLDAHSQHRKQRRGTGLSRSSKKSSRSGSSNTMKKVRTRDSIDERRRESTDVDVAR